MAQGRRRPAADPGQPRHGLRDEGRREEDSRWGLRGLYCQADLGGELHEHRRAVSFARERREPAMTARVLVVDDVELNVKLLEAKLSSEYFEVIVADNGPAALELAETEMPDIILLDVMMPLMDGFEVCRRLKANPRTADVPVVMVTALSDVADRLRGLESGADDFLTKPVNDIALFARVRSLVRLKRMMEEWRLREEICGRFATAPGAVEKPEDLSPARILLLEDNRPPARRIAE